MDLFVEHVDVWAATIPDTAGGLAGVLATLHDVGANLQSIISRRAPDQPGKGVVFVTPLQGDREIAAAAQAGFNVTQTLHSVRILGTDRPGIAAELTQRLADAGINLRGFSASVIGTQFSAYAAMDSLEDAKKAIEILKMA
jgi:predicted amino acid-binding ACT domain protein